jgi:hypothetical protein
MMEWRPATIDEVVQIVRDDLARCDAEQVAVFNRHRVEPYHAPILRAGQMESVVIIARKGNEVMYWEDVEEGFNLSPIGLDGGILEPGAAQDELPSALNHWIESRR